jgi:formate hydrogenlyase subunit 3/multisubunit Na+/H+ antiporter MnhD subunit
MAGSSAVVLPFVILIAGAFGVYLIARFLHLHNKVEALLTTFVLGSAFIVLLNIVKDVDSPLPIFGIAEAGGILYQVDIVGSFITGISLLIGILITIYSGEYLSRDPRYQLYYPLIILTLAGLLGMFFTKDLFHLFLLTEFVSVTVSALIAFRYHREISVKAGFKYLIMSSLGTMIMLFGIYFVFRGVNSLDISEVLHEVNTFTRIGAGCFLAGFSIKVGVVPVHTWVPEVYSGAPSAISGLLAGVISKSMLFIMALTCTRLGLEGSELGLYLITFGFINMLLGSIRALNQNHIRRFLSFSSIAQTGYLMFIMGIGFFYQLEAAFLASLFLFLVIAVMKCLAFLSAGIYEYHLRTGTIDDLQGVHTIMPSTAYFFSLSLAGLAGIPLLAGFTGKWLTFSAAIATGDTFAILGVIIFLISTLIGLGGYLPMIVKQFLKTDKQSAIVDASRQTMRPLLWMQIPVGILSLLVVLIGLYPAPWVNIVDWIVNWMIAL